MRPWLGSARPRPAACALAALLITVQVGIAEESPADGIGRFPPVLASAVAPVRQALIVAPQGAHAPRGARLGTDGAAYRDRLRLLGFEVTVVEAETRPDLDSALRGFARSVKRDADVALFLLGSVRPVTDGLVLMPPNGSPSRETTPEAIGTEGLRLADVLRRIADRSAKGIAVIADACGPSADHSACAAGLADLPEGVSVIMARPAERAADGSPPLAGVGSIGPDLLRSMSVEGRTFQQLYAALAEQLADTDLGVVGTPALTRSFAFWPAGFLEGLPLACNRVDGARSAEQLEDDAALDPLVADCAEAAARYAFSLYFKTRLDIVTEQRAAQKALARCEDAAFYLSTYPDGRYRAAIGERRRTCAAPPAIPSPVRPATDLERRARAAVADYFHRHDYRQGDPFGALSRLYPAEVRNGGVVVSRTDYLRRLGAWYGGFDDVRFHVVDQSLDLAGCVQETDCLVRGRYESQRLRAGESSYDRVSGAFALRFDVPAAVVTAECGVTDAAQAPGPACD